MGCLKSIIRLIIFISIIFAFFYFGGPKFIKEKYDGYTSPKREILIEEEKNFGNLSYIPESFTLQRSISVGKYKKITAEHQPSGQKINIIDTGDNTAIEQSDFYNKEIDLKLSQILDKIKNTPLAFENMEITQRGTILAKGKIVPYVNFKTKIKNIPFITISGTFAAYNTINSKENIISKIENTINNNKDRTTTKVIVSMKLNNYSFDITKELIQSLSFTGIN